MSIQIRRNTSLQVRGMITSVAFARIHRNAPDRLPLWLPLWRSSMAATAGRQNQHAGIDPLVPVESVVGHAAGVATGIQVSL
jgi:hypothetical protein